MGRICQPEFQAFVRLYILRQESILCIGIKQFQMNHESQFATFENRPSTRLDYEPATARRAPPPWSLCGRSPSSWNDLASPLWTSACVVDTRACRAATADSAAAGRWASWSDPWTSRCPQTVGGVRFCRTFQSEDFRLNGFLGLSLIDRTILFLVILLCTELVF